MRIMKNRLYIYSNDVSLTKTYYLYLCSVKVAMEYVITFLQSSTIHGLPFIATTSRHVRFFWILVVTFGFIMSGYIIHQSFEAWNESPIKTTIETRPITEITFPKVTVCPPKNTLTDLNYHLMMAENMTLQNETRNELKNYAMGLLYNHLYESIMKNFSKLEEKDRYYNWYHGLTQIIWAEYYDDNWFHGVRYYVRTYALSGSVNTQFFGENFDVDKVETDVTFYYGVQLETLEHIREDQNVTLHIEIEKISIKELSTGDSSFNFEENLDVDVTHVIKNFTPPEQYSYSVTSIRKVSREDVLKQKLQLMPGFRISWYYTGIATQPIFKYSDYGITPAFVRNGSIVDYSDYLNLAYLSSYLLHTRLRSRYRSISA